MHRKDSRFAPRKLILPVTLAGVFGLGAAHGAHGAHARQTAASGSVAAVHYYDLKPAPLVQTLEAIAAISGRRIDFDRADLAKGRAGAVIGDFSAGAAIGQALAGTRYILNEDNAGILVVTPGAKVEVVARRDQAETEFKADRSDTATRSGTSLHLVPGSVTLITGKVLETQQATDLTDALRNVSGMGFARTPQANTTFNIRGFDATSDSNGITDNSATMRSVFAVERVEVLKGPQAILSGGDSLGGAVNIVVKKPQAETIRDLTVQYGSHDDRTIAADLSGVAGDDGRLTARTVASLQDAHRNDVGMNGKNSKSFMQALRWKDRTTDFTASAEYTNEKNPLGRYTFARRDGVILPVPDRLLASPADGVDAKVRRFGYQLERTLGDNAVLISRLQVTRQDIDLHIPAPSGLQYAEDAAPDTPLPDVEFFASRMFQKEHSLSGDHYLRFNVPTGDVRHKLSVGFNHNNDDIDQTQYSGDSATVPVYSPAPYAFRDLRDRATTLITTFGTSQRQRALYAQDLMSYDKWNLLLNWRRTHYTTPELTSFVYADSGASVFRTAPTDTYHTTPGAGLVYQLNDETSLYASYSEGFQPTNAVQCGGGLVPPDQTRNREIGAKFDLFDSRFTLTASAFSLQRSNTLQFDQFNNCYNVRNGQRTRGAEIDAQGRLLPGLETIFNYTYTRVKDVGEPGTLFAGKPKHKMNLWAVYKFQAAALKGFGVGVGVSATSNSLGIDRAPLFTVPGGAQVDSSLYYATGPWNATLGVKNVFDRTLYDTAVTDAYIPVLPGRTYALTVKRSFQ